MLKGAKRIAVRDAVDRFEQAAVDRSWAGGREPAARAETEQEYAQARAHLLELIGVD